MNDNLSAANMTERTLRPEPPQAGEQPVTPPAPASAMMQRQAVAVARTCPFCGAENDAEAMFCAQCGQPVSKTVCPHCGAEIDPDADFCEACHHYIRKDICSYCGSSLSGNEAYCPECGCPRGGMVCPTCHTLNEFAFCKKCGTALTEEARQLERHLQRNPDYQELLRAVNDFESLENALPYHSERDIVRDQMNARLRERVLTLLAKDAGVENPVISPLRSKRMSAEELEKRKADKVRTLSAILDRLAIQPGLSPVKARNYAMASKPIGVRLAWVCNYKHAMHSSPCGCAKPQLGGKWVVLGRTSREEIKDDK